MQSLLVKKKFEKNNNKSTTTTSSGAVGKQKAVFFETFFLSAGKQLRRLRVIVSSIVKVCLDGVDTPTVSE